MNLIAKWLRNVIDMTPFMVHDAHFRSFLRRAFEISPDDCHREFSPARLSAGESVVPIPNDSLMDSRRAAIGPPTAALDGSSASLTPHPRELLLTPRQSRRLLSTSPAPSSLSAPDDTEMADFGGAADASLVTSQSAAT